MGNKKTMQDLPPVAMIFADRQYVIDYEISSQFRKGTDEYDINTPSVAFVHCYLDNIGIERTN